MKESDAVVIFKKECPDRIISSIEPYKNGYRIDAESKGSNGDDFSGTVFYVTSKGVQKLSLTELLTS